MKVVSAAKKVHRKAIAPVAGALGRGVRRIIGSKHETSRDRIFAALAAMRKKWLPPNESQ